MLTSEATKPLSKKTRKGTSVFLDPIVHGRTYVRTCHQSSVLSATANSDVRLCRYNRFMGRWKPDSAGRLVQAALTLFGERGFDQTTAEEIARQAGLTERTFFRYFADKREVLFYGADDLKRSLIRLVAMAPESASPIEAVTSALVTAGRQLEERREFAQRRQAIIAANPELRERELIKLATIASALAETLRRARRQRRRCNAYVRSRDGNLQDCSRPLGHGRQQRRLATGHPSVARGVESRDREQARTLPTGSDSCLGGVPETRSFDHQPRLERRSDVRSGHARRAS